MKLIRNDAYIKKNKTIGNIITFSSLGVLGLGLYFAFQKDMTMVMYSYICLIVGFLLTQFGMFYTNRFGRSPRYDEVLTEAFDKLRHEYTFYVHSTPVPMALLGPCGLWLPMPITATGEVSYEKGKWKQKGGGFLSRFMGQEGIGKPDREVAYATRDIEQLLSSKGIALEDQPEIKPVMIVMFKKTTVGDLTDAPYPVIPLEELKRYIRREDRENCTAPQSPEQIEAIKAALDTGLEPIDLKETKTPA